MMHVEELTVHFLCHYFSTYHSDQNSCGQLNECCPFVNNPFLSFCKPHYDGLSANLFAGELVLFAYEKN